MLRIVSVLEFFFQNYKEVVLEYFNFMFTIYTNTYTFITSIQKNTLFFLSFDQRRERPLTQKQFALLI